MTWALGIRRGLRGRIEGVDCPTWTVAAPSDSLPPAGVPRVGLGSKHSPNWGPRGRFLLLLLGNEADPQAQGVCTRDPQAERGVARPGRSGPGRPLGDCFLVGFVQGNQAKWLSACKLQFQPGTPPLVLLTSLLTSAQSIQRPETCDFARSCAVEVNIQPITKNIPQDSRGAQVSLLVGRSGRRAEWRRSRSTADPLLEPRLETVARKKNPGRCTGAAEGDLAAR